MQSLDRTLAHLDCFTASQRSLRLESSWSGQGRLPERRSLSPRLRLRLARRRREQLRQRQLLRTPGMHVPPGYGCFFFLLSNFVMLLPWLICFETSSIVQMTTLYVAALTELCLIRVTVFVTSYLCLILPLGAALS